MRRLLFLLALLSLSGCASDGYRYHDDGYWTARNPARPAIFIHGSISSCWGWYGPAAYPYYGSWGSSCSPLSYLYGPWWYGGPSYGYNSYWYDRWYLPRTLDQQRAGLRARAMASEFSESTLEPGSFPQFEDVAPMRRRDTGGGDRAFRSTPRYYGPDLTTSRQQGLGSVGAGRNSGATGMSSRSASAPSAPTPSSNTTSTRSASNREREEN